METRNHLNIESLISGPLMRLRNVVRFSNSSRNSNETVAEHSFYVAMFSMLIYLDMEQRGFFNKDNALDLRKMLMRALVHDVEESHSGDFIRTFKHSSPELSQAIENASTAFMHVIFNGILHDPKELVQAWMESKENSLEGHIVRFADFLSVVSYIFNEVKRGNIGIYKDNRDSLHEYAKEFDQEKYEHLAPYLEQVFEVLYRLDARGGL
jgi:5'-deoxynucleotidase YfbR-like HD superfamily hydrolase